MKKTKFIPVAQPALIGNEKKYVNDCLNSNWISSKGKYIELFEKKFADYLGVKYAISCNNGTSALHLAMLALGIGAGDEVICPTFTYVATANSIKYVGAKPIFVDCEPDTFNIDPKKIEKAVTKKTKAIIIVPLYGHPCEMDAILKIADKHRLYLIEDAAEALGAEYKGKKVGTFGDVATFSFFGNKTITTGEGGMVIIKHKEVAEKVKLFKGQGMNPNKLYWFEVVGYNYRMTNMQAALGLAQIENVDKFIIKRLDIARWYREALKNIKEIEFVAERSGVKHSWWMCSMLVKKAGDRDKLMKFLKQNGVETRPFFYPMHIMPANKNSASKNLPVAEDAAARGINLPTFYDLRHDEINSISKSIIRYFKK